MPTKITQAVNLQYDRGSLNILNMQTFRKKKKKFARTPGTNSDI